MSIALGAGFRPPPSQVIIVELRTSHTRDASARHPWSASEFCRLAGRCLRSPTAMSFHAISPLLSLQDTIYIIYRYHAFFWIVGTTGKWKYGDAFPNCHSIQHTERCECRCFWRARSPETTIFAMFFGTFRTRKAVNANGFEPLWNTVLFEGIYSKDVSEFLTWLFLGPLWHSSLALPYQLLLYFT